MPSVVKRLQAAFFRAPGGAEPVREWLRSLAADDRKVLGRGIAAVEFGWPVGMPVCRPLGDGLWEIRSRLAGGRIARILFSASEGRLILLHGFVKKTPRTPPESVAVARSRMKEIER